MPVVELPELSLHYRREGSGEPLLLLAGMTSDAASWQPVWAALTARFDVIAPDNRCTGRTRPMPIVSSREHMLDDVQRLLDALELPRVAVLGHSMGAMLGWALAAAVPERVSALVAAGGLPEVPPVRVDYFRTLAALRRTSEPALWYRLLFHALFSPAFFADPQRVEAAAIGALTYPHQQSPDALSVQADALESFASTPPIERLRCPVLALTGELDLFCPPARLAERHAGDERVRLSTLPGAAHALHWEAPDEFVARVTAFLGTLRY